MLASSAASLGSAEVAEILTMSVSPSSLTLTSGSRPSFSCTASWTRFDSMTPISVWTRFWSLRWAVAWSVAPSRCSASLPCSSTSAVPRYIGVCWTVSPTATSTTTSVAARISHFRRVTTSR